MTDSNRPSEPEILDACCGGRMWWWDKDHPLAVYMDTRVAEKGCVDVRPNFEVRPDVVGDFRAMPFDDGAFQLVLFDPPHNVRDKPDGGYIGLKYGALPAETEQNDLRRGFAECWRVLAPGGTLVFKWAGALERVKPHFPDTPIVGTRSPRGGQTRWFVFYKGLQRVESHEETPKERLERIRQRANEARPHVSMTPGQAATLRRAQRGL